MILNHPSLSKSEVKLLVKAADSVYQNQMSLDGWQVITPDLTNPNYGLAPELITGNTFKVQGSFLNLPYGDANAAILKSGDNLLLAFRGTEIPKKDQSYWLRLEEHYNLFEPLFTALDNYIQANPTSKILVTGHSLGAAMAEFYMAEHPGALYSAVTVASPTASNDPTDTRILNIGFENDPVYEITSGDPSGIGNGGADPNNSTTNLFLDLDVTGLFGINNHASSEYVYAVERLFDSAYYEQTERDSFVMVERKNSNVNVSDVYLSTDRDVFILGEDNKADNIKGDKKNDVLEGLGGNDTLQGDLISARFFSGNDQLDGGKGNDQLDGSEGNQDTAVFSGNFEDYDYSISEDKKTITFAHARGTQTDGTDTLKNIEWGAFKDTTQPIGNARLASTPAPRIIPLPLEDGEKDIEAVKATDTTLNPNSNDLPTPPYVSLTAPVAMLDGNVDYTLNISPYKPDSKYNVVYFLDTSSTNTTSGTTNLAKFEQEKSAYIDLTNYFVNSGLAENINFGIVTFNNSATLQTDAQGDRNFTAAEAIAKIQGLTATTGVGRNYDAALWEGVNFLTTSPLKPSSPLNPGGTTSLSYFYSDNVNTSDRFTMLNTAKTLRRFSNVQAFGVNGVANSNFANDINFIDSNGGVFMGTSADLSAELGKSGLAGTVSAVNILVDGVVVDTVQPSELIDSPLGLTYKGSIDELDVSVNAKNVITAEAVFNNNTATTTAEFTVTAGKGKLTDASGNPLVEPPVGNDEDPFKRIRNGGSGNDDITLGYVDQGASGGIGDDYIVGNKRDNQLDGGDGNDIIIGHEGNDTIITGAGTNKVTGGAGIDTVLYGNVAYPGSTSLRQAASSVLYNNTDTLTEVEYLQFSDVRISAKTLAVVPILNAADVSITEGDSGTKIAQFTFNLSTPAPGNVVFNYSTADIDAVAGTDYVATSGQVTIPAGQTSASVNFTINGDTTYEANETFGLTLSGISGATFKDNVTEYNATVTIANDDPVNYAPFSSGIPNTITTTNAPNQSINLAQAFQDLEDTNLTYSVQNNTNSTLFDAVTVDQANKILLLDYKASTTGSSVLTVRATDSKGLFVDTTFTVSAIAATSNNDTIAGGDSADYLDGGAGNDNLSGLGKDDTLTGGAGVDTLVGGVGNDLYIVDTATDTITENANEGIDTVSSTVTYTLGATSNLENITLTGISAINATGNATSNALAGNSGNNNLAGGVGNDSMTGGAGLDTLIGGAGNDLYTVDTATDIITESVSEGTDTVASTVTYTLGATSNLENLTLTGASGINGTGNSLNNTITGNSVTNGIVGGAGNDTMTGGAGNDFYNVDSAGDVVIESNTPLELDTVRSSVNYALSDNVERLTLIGTSGINGMGNNLNNTIAGNTANNQLDGNTGSDTMTGDTGNDTYVVDAIGDVVSEASTVTTEIDSVQSVITYTLGANVENLTLTGASGINGTGNSLNNTITGNSAANGILGGTGNDTMTGGAGNDVYFVDSTGDMINETSILTTEIDTVQSGVSYTLGANVERLTLTGTTAINGTGNSLNNTITGNSAANGILGGAGNDTMTGGAGNDVYIVDSTGDVINETSVLTTEIDTVQSWVSYVLGANVERLTLIGTSVINGTGNDLNNTVTGNSANNTLFGGIGSDTITGGNGSDRLIGASGNDSLSGGDGSDRFIYDSNAAFTSNAIGIDRIADFVSGTDKIVLDKTTFTALTSIAGNGFNLASEFAVVGTDAAASTSNALIVYSSETDNLFYNQNGATSGLGSGAQLATLSGITTLSPSDFELQV